MTRAAMPRAKAIVRLCGTRVRVHSFLAHSDLASILRLADDYNCGFGFQSIGGRMGKGDVRTRRGKIFNGSYGKKRPHKKRRKKS